MTTRADDKIREMAALTHPILKKFALKWGADFSILDHISGCTIGDGRYHYRIMKFYDLLLDYDRILSIDSDIIINKNCPNLFDVVPYDKIGTIFEDKGSRLIDRKKRIQLIQKEWGEIGWRSGYINTGVFLVSREHRQVFKKFKNKYWVKSGFDDVHLGYQIHRLGLKIFELNWQFNHMSIFSESWNKSPSRFDSYIIHYAGHTAFPDKGNRTKVNLIEDDIHKIYRKL